MELDEITYQATKKSLDKFPEILEQQRKTLLDMGLTDEQIERALAPTLSFMAGIREDVEHYEKKQEAMRALRKSIERELED